MTISPPPPTAARRAIRTGRAGRTALSPLTVLGALTALTALTVLTGCTAGSGAPDGTTPGSTTVLTATAPPSSITPVSEAPLTPSAAVVETPAPNNTCPYISNDAARAAEGDRVGRVTLTTTDPVGCNFYWAYDENRMILQIAVTNYPSQTGAYNAMIRDTAGSSERLGVESLIAQTGCDASTAVADRPTACVDAVLFRTTLYPPDGDRDWACAFAKNSRVITVRTQQDDVSFNAKNAAAQVAPAF